VALVTGSYRGTGAGIARVLAAEGATVLVHGLEPGQTDATARAITDAGGTCRSVTGDIRIERGTAELVTAVRDAVDRVDIVVNNYGVAEGSDWETSDTESWHASYDTNVVSAVRVTQAFLPDMRAARWGRVVFVSTVGATRPGDRIPEYYAVKGALPFMTVSLAKDLAGTGITVNCVSPGIIATSEVVASYTERARREGVSTDWPNVERLILGSRMGNFSRKLKVTSTLAS
jgi:3-oxoacyl-[acyl-carrier protein] reductase